MWRVLAEGQSHIILIIIYPQLKQWAIEMINVLQAEFARPIKMKEDKVPEYGENIFPYCVAILLSSGTNLNLYATFNMEAIV